MSKTRRLLLCDGPPIQNGNGCHRLAWLLLQAQPTLFTALLTRRFFRRPGIDWVAQLPITKWFVAPDESSLLLPRLPALRAGVGLTLWCFYLLWNRRRLLADNPDHIFAFFGADAFFILRCEAARILLGLPLEIYVVDELEAWERSNPNWLRRCLVRRHFPRMLRQASAVYGISTGFSEFLQMRYSVSSIWLPITMPVLGTRQYSTNKIVIVHVGSINELYRDALVEAEAALRALGRPELRLRLLTRELRKNLPAELRNSPLVEVCNGLAGEQIDEEVGSAQAILIVYSHSSEMETMVRTSFPTKMTEALTAGRPILIYGPAYSSVARFFGRQDMAYVVTDPAQLSVAYTAIFSEPPGNDYDRYSKARALLNPVSILEQS